ncbi:MAG: PAS domain S-box protein [Desulfobacteraceae bacterium]|nr:PAS domain S-box protein [Desulfobacteraceae bacterium]
MKIDFENLNIAFICGNLICKAMIQILLGENFQKYNIKILGVLDSDNTEGLQCAKDRGIFTTNNLKDILTLKDLNLIIKLSKKDGLAEIIEKSKSSKTKFLNYFESLFFFSQIQIENQKLETEKKLKKYHNIENIKEVFTQYSSSITEIIDQKAKHFIEEGKELAESEKALSQIINGSMIPTFIINKEHIVTHWNRALEKITGFSADGIVGTNRQWAPFRSEKRPTMADVIVGEMSEEDVDRYYGSSWRKSTLIEEAYEAEEFFPNIGDGGKWFFFTAAPIKASDGTVIGAIETLLDETKDKKLWEEKEFKDNMLLSLHEQCQKSEEKYKSLFNNNPNPIFIIDCETFKILDVNNRVEAEYGYTKTDLLKKSFFELCDNNDITIANDLKTLPKNKSILFSKKKHFRKNQDPIFVNIKVYHAEYNNRDALIASATDITENIEKETQLIQAGKMATLGTMAAGMAHEINQPLNVIQICADLIRKIIKKGHTITNQELDTMANDIIDNVERAADVIKHVRDFARQSERNLKKITINDPINDVFKVLGHQLSIHQINVELDLDPDIPDIMAEHNRLEQVFINLVTNAIDSMDEKIKKMNDSNIENLLKIKSFVEKDHVVITVSDTGIGMSNDVKNKLFEPFFTTKEPGKGTGLGTSISYGIITDYGGTVDIESKRDKGAKFTIKFPSIS